MFDDIVVPEWQKQQGVDYQLVSSSEDLRSWILSIPPELKPCLDTETTGLDTELCQIVGFSLSYRQGEAIYVPIHHETGTEYNMDERDAFACIRLLLDRHKILIYHAKFDCDILEYKCGILPGTYSYEDVLLSVYMSDSNQKSERGLKDMAKKLFGIEMIEYEELVQVESKKGRKKVYQGFQVVHPKAAVPYACADADLGLRVYHYFAPVREEQSFIYKIETALTEVLRRQEKNRFQIDLPYIDNIEAILKARIEELTGEIHKLAGTQFDIDSPTQLGKILFEDLGLKLKNPFDDYNEITPYTEKSRSAADDKKKYATDAKVLEWMANEHPIISKVVEYRSLVKQLSTYAHALKNGLNDRNEAKFNYFQYRVPTGRLAAGSDRVSSGDVRPGAYMNVNVHSIPKNYGKKIFYCGRLLNSPPINENPFHYSNFEGQTFCLGFTPKTVEFVKKAAQKKGTVLNSDHCPECDPAHLHWGYFDISKELNIRKAFKARPGYKIVGIDYSQVELRMAANLSGTKIWVEAYKAGRDLHEEMSLEMFKSTDPALRTIAKNLNFGCLYGGNEYTLARQANCSMEEAKKSYDAWRKAVPDYLAWCRRIHAEARRDGFVKTYFGRKRPIPWFNDAGQLGYANRSAVNTLIQGVSADILKISLVRLDSIIRKNYSDDIIKILLNVHDEIVFEVLCEKLGEIVPLLKKTMELEVTSWAVPLVAEPEVGDNWGELVDFDDYLADLSNPPILLGRFDPPAMNTIPQAYTLPYSGLSMTLPPVLPTVLYSIGPSSTNAHLIDTVSQVQNSILGTGTSTGEALPVSDFVEPTNGGLSGSNGNGDLRVALSAPPPVLDLPLTSESAMMLKSLFSECKGSGTLLFVLGHSLISVSNVDLGKIYNDPLFNSLRADLQVVNIGRT